MLLFYRCFSSSQFNERDKIIYISGCNEVVTWVNFRQSISISSSQVSIYFLSDISVEEYLSVGYIVMLIIFIFLKQLESFRSLKDGDGNPLVDNFRPPLPLNGRYIGHGGMEYDYPV